ncbi:MAG: tetratricopeptide repeat protein [Flavobacteriales bacterium]|nr:tetratricopeptide repeat protein [Flavobacteriales bacterium]
MLKNLVLGTLMCLHILANGQDRLEELYQEGIGYYAMGKYALAVQSFSSILNSSSEYDYKNCLFLRAKAYSKTGRNAEAIQDLDKAIKYHPDSLSYFDLRAYAYSYVGDFIGAIRDYTTVMRYGGDSVKYLLLRSEAKMNEGDYKSAVEDCDKVIKIQPRSFVPYKQKGMIYLIAKNEESALHQLNRALELNPKDAESYFFRTIAKIKKRDLPGASQDYKQAVRFDPDYNDPNILKGIELYLDKRFEDACSTWKNSFKISKPVAKELREVYCDNK